MRLTGAQIGELTEMVCDAFTRNELAFLVRAKLNLVLDNQVSVNVNDHDAAFQLIDELNRLERAVELMRAIVADRPADTKIKRFCDPLLAQANGFALPASAGALGSAVAAVSDAIQQRHELFKYLAAYKELHDVLHELQSFHPKVAAAVAERKTDPTQPLAEDVVFFLEDHVRIACESAKEIEFPEKPPAWIAKLVVAVEMITGAEVEKMPRQVERLKTLPPEGLAAMNEKLFENARRLDPQQLIGSLNEILTPLGTGENPATAKLRAEVGEFRTLCSELDALINAHNLCQKIDDALREAAGLPSVTPGELSDWGVAKKSLDELASQRGHDKRVQRTNEAAKLFETANQGQAFTTLIERFDDLFMETDKALLKVTNKLPRKAIALRTALEEFQ
jgi:hypothetical protein